MCGFSLGGLKPLHAPRTDDMGWDAVMTRAPSEIGRAIARLSGDPTFAAFAKPDAAILVFDEAAERILWASPAAAGLAEAMSRFG